MGLGQTDPPRFLSNTAQNHGGLTFAVLPVCCPRGKVLCRSKPAAGHPVGAPGWHHKHPPPENLRFHTKSLSFVRARAHPAPLPDKTLALENMLKNLRLFVVFSYHMDLALRPARPNPLKPLCFLYFLSKHY